jgi:hypothetical protein
MIVDRGQTDAGLLREVTKADRVVTPRREQCLGDRDDPLARLANVEASARGLSPFAMSGSPVSNVRSKTARVSSIAGVNPFLQQIVTGLVLILAVLLSQARTVSIRKVMRGLSLRRPG